MHAHITTHPQGTHEMNVNLVGKQERALNVLKVRSWCCYCVHHCFAFVAFVAVVVAVVVVSSKKSKLLERISNSSEQDTGERLLNEYHINLKVLDQEIERCVCI